MASERLGARHHRHRLPKHAAQGYRLGEVVVERASAMGIDILDILRLKASHRQCLRHGQIGTFAIVGCGRLVEGVAGVAPSGEPSVDISLALPGPLCPLHHQVGSTLAEIESGAGGIEGPTGLFVEDHQRPEAVEVEGRQGLGASGHHNVGLASLQQSGTQYDGVGCRGAGGGDGGAVGKTAKVVGYLLGIAAGIVGEQARQVVVAVLHLGEEPLGDVHASHSGAGDENEAEGRGEW